jgi:hypothetical protein
MRKIVTLVLVMLVGGYGAVRAQTPMEMEMATEMEMDAQDFLGLKWGAGIGVMGGFGGDTSVEKASIVVIGEDENAKKIVHVEEEGELRPQVFLEMHAFVGGKRVKEWRKYQRKKAAYEMEMTRLNARERQAEEEEDGERREAIRDSIKKEKDKWNWPAMPKELPEKGCGPFIALQGSDENAIDALAVGIMWGFRKIPSDSLSVNIGVGLSFDPSVQILAKDFKEGNAAPNGETAVRFKKEGRFGWALMASFTF